ncbi:hypothetical protein BDV06DRAFT_156645 [Aspergillus oleicola]
MAAPALLERFPVEMIEEVIRCLKGGKDNCASILHSLPTTSEDQITTALEWMAKNGNDRSMTYLIKSSLKTIKKSPKLQWDSLLNSCAAGFVEAVRVLLDAGVSPNVEASLGRRMKRSEATGEPRIVHRLMSYAMERPGLVLYTLQHRLLRLKS